MAKTEIGAAADSALEAMGRRYCTSCSKTKPTEGGTLINTGKGKTASKRWRCKSCKEEAQSRLNNRNKEK